MKGWSGSVLYAEFYAVLSGPSPPPSMPSSPALCANGSKEYKTPWDKMSKEFMNILKNGKRPMPSQRREMVRIIIGDVHVITSKPSKKQLGSIAEKIVNQYPKSFRDMIGPDIIGTAWIRFSVEEPGGQIAEPEP